jgi:AcrR family transcriptional regulator
VAHPRFDNLDDDKKERIIEAAGEEFADKGFDGASINAIIAQAGISKGSLYYYFEDKTDLFATVMTHASERVLKVTKTLTFDHLTAENFWSSLEAMTEQGMAYAVKKPWFMRLSRTFFERYQAGDKSQAVQQVINWSHRANMALIERGQALGVVRTDVPADMLAAATMGVGEGMSRWLLTRWDDSTQEDFIRYKKTQLDLMRRILSP